VSPPASDIENMGKIEKGFKFIKTKGFVKKKRRSQQFVADKGLRSPA
jgi:DNA-binding transcriptional regulator YhcF (GntR family)